MKCYLQSVHMLKYTYVVHPSWAMYMMWIAYNINTRVDVLVNII